MKYGHFDDTSREYVITDCRTPLPWINYLGTQDFFSLCSNTGGGYGFYRDARLRRLTRFRYNSIPADSEGRYFFINDAGRVWCPTWAPVRGEIEGYECRHGFGYTRITSRLYGVEASQLMFVPVDETAEIHQLTLTNTGDTPKDLRVFSYAEFCLWDALDDQSNYQRNLSLAEMEVDGSAIYHLTEYRERRNHFAVYGVNSPIVGFDTDRDTFIGAYRHLGEAEVPLSGRSRGSTASGWYPIASHHLCVHLEAGETSDLIFVLGYVENDPDDKWESPGVVKKDRARALLSRFSTTEQVNQAMDELAQYWEDLLSVFRIESADPKLDRMVNLWNPYQCMATFNLSRSASYFETGIGRGMGFRDSNQDLLGIVSMVPERARQRLLDLAATQFRDGSAYHQYQPLTKRGNNDLGSGFNDDPLWLVWGAVTYIKETGDMGILDEPVPFENDDTLSKPLVDHLIASWRHVEDNLGPHGLPLIGRADWNDCLNLNAFTTTAGESFQTTTNREGKVAESVFIAGMFCAIGPDLAILLDHTGLGEEAGTLRRDIAAMREAILTHGWDGEWYLRAYDAFSAPVGTHNDTEGQIFIEPQGMCVMAGVGVKEGYAKKALDSVVSRLGSEHGLALVAPAYRSYRVNLGEITSYPPGYKENGGIFCHNNPWIIIAETIAGDPGRAFDYYRRITPAYRESISDVHQLEPYVYAQMITGVEAPRFGQAKNSWLTGAAAWAYHAITNWILGVRADFNGLIVDPKIPEGFGDFTVTRVFRDATYHITVSGSGSGYLSVDGVPLEGNLVPLATPGAHVNVVWRAA